MHTFGDTGAGVPAFLAKLWRLVEDSETNDLIYWSTDGRSFIIQNQARFAKELLPLNYKHNNMASFIRQLNMYGFHKITSIDNGGLRFDRDEMEFSHPCFQKGHPYLLEHIKRKIAHPKVQESKESVKIEAVNRMLTEVKTMRGRQDALDSRFSSMKQENEALWREVAILRQKHMKQQQIVNKLIQFLVTMVQPSRSGLSGMGRRRYQLMINDAPRSSKNNRSASPIIHELEEELLDEVANNEDSVISDIPNISSPPGPDDDSCSLQSGSDPSNGRKSVDYLVDHIDDFEQTESSPPLNIPYEDTLSASAVKNEFDNVQRVNHERARKRTLSASGGDDAFIMNKAARKKTGQTSAHAESASGQKSLLKGQNNGGKQMNVKLENDSYGYVPDVSTTLQQQKQTASPSSSTGSGKSFYSKDDLFSDEVPSELFDDGSELVQNDPPMLSSTGLNISAGAYNPNTQLLSSKSQNSTAGTSSNETSRPTLTLADGTNMQVAKFSGKSNGTDITKLNTATIPVYPEQPSTQSQSSHLDSHLNDVQDDLDALKDILRGENYQFDANTLLNNLSGGDQSNFSRYFLSQPVDVISKLFNNEDGLAYELPLDTNSVASIPPAAPSPGTNAALTEYQPVVDLSELLDIATPNPSYDENNQAATTTAGT